MPTNFYDLGTLSSVTSTSATTIKEAYDGSQGIFRYVPTDDCAFTGIALQGRDDGGSWVSVQAITDADKALFAKVTLYREMRMTCTGGSTGTFTGYVEPL